MEENEVVGMENEIVESAAGAESRQEGGADEREGQTAAEVNSGAAKGAEGTEKGASKAAKDTGAPKKVSSLKDLRKLAETGGFPSKEAKKGEGETGAKPGAVAKVGAEGEGENTEQAESSKPAFTPKLSVTIRNKEVAIPEKFKALMTDEKSQREIHELFEKAGGLDVIKPKHQELIQQYGEKEKQLTGVMGSINSVRRDYQNAVQLFQRGQSLEAMSSMDAFFSKMKVPEEVVMRYALEKAKFAQLPPEQQQMFQERKQAELQAQQYQEQAQNSMQGSAATEAKLLDLQLKFELAKPEIADAKAYYESLEGNEPGSFRELVIQYGIQQHALGKELSPEEAVAGVIKSFGLGSLAKAKGSNLSAGPKPTDSIEEEQVEDAPPPKVVKKKVVNTGTLPNVSSTGVSPVKQGVKSLKQLKEIAKNFSG